MTGDAGWRYGAIGPGEGDTRANVRIGREISQADFVAVADATRLLNGVGPGSAFAALSDQFRLFERTVAEAEADTPGAPAKGELRLLRLDSAVDNVLFAFRAFVDRTEHQLSKLYGNPSAELGRFRDACSAQFDQFVEYRLAVKLRNYSQHVGSVISNVNSRAELNEGLIARSFEVVIRPDFLLNNYNSWGPVKRDLEEMDDVIHVADVVRQVELCCTTIMGHLLNAQRAGLLRAVDVVNQASGECELGPGEQPCLFHLPERLPQGPGEVFKPSMQPIRVDLAEMALSNLKSAEALLP